MGCYYFGLLTVSLVFQSELNFRIQHSLVGYNLNPAKLWHPPPCVARVWVP